MLVSAEEVELVECDAEVLDVRNGPAKVTRTAPPKIKNFVLARDKGRCVVPGCRNRGVHFHHEDGWRSGHHEDRCFCLCDSHHRSRHLGFLRVEGSMPDLHFCLADGSYLGRAGDEERATDPSSREAEPMPRSAPAHGPAHGEPSPATSLEEATADAPAHVRTPPPLCLPRSHPGRAARPRAGRLALAGQSSSCRAGLGLPCGRLGSCPGSIRLTWGRDPEGCEALGSTSYSRFRHAKAGTRLFQG